MMPRTVVLATLHILALMLILATGCATVPNGEPMTMPQSDSTGLLFIAHGYGNNPSHWPAKLIRQIRDSGADLSGWDIYAHDWEAQANKPLTATRSGAAIGREIARQLISSGDQYEVLHLVGQSLGAHLTQAIADEYRRLQGGAYIQMTFMEPFLIRGIFGIGYGVRRFGRGADFAENYVVLNEPVLGSNRYLRHAHNTDVTVTVREDLKDEFFGPHWWAVEYYRQSVVNDRPGFNRSPIATGSLINSATGSHRVESSGTLDDYFAALRSSFPPGESLVLETEPPTAD